MRLLALSLVVMLSLPAGAQPDGGMAVIEDWYQCPTAPPLEPVDGGYFCSEARAKRLACIIAGFHKERDLLREETQMNPPWVGIVIALGLGFVAGFAIDRATHH